MVVMIMVVMVMIVVQLGLISVLLNINPGSL